jgi:YHS domain-containing protein
MDKKIQWALVAALWVLVLGGLGLAYEFIHQRGAAASSADAAPAQVGDKVLDPVSKNEVVVGKDSPHVNYQGRDYYFEAGTASDHKVQFLMDPDLYLKGVSSYQAQAAALKAASAAAALQPAPTALASPAAQPAASASTASTPTALPLAKATARPALLQGGLPTWNPNAASPTATSP